ncbi:MAG TPA: tRNA-specific adenosine deaminase [Ruminococcaceae bacterium]|nr:tRNA-specific adenosine deaminase [Oscillospiraceae bacterium]
MMGRTIELAKTAYELGEVPVGAVVVKNGEIIGEGYNRRETCQNAVLHAEIEAISGACGAIGSWRLDGCDLFVTLEPCPMCAGAAVNARISRVIFGAFDYKAGCCDSLINLFNLPFEHTPEVFAGICEDECAALLTGFFRERRQ